MRCEITGNRMMVFRGESRIIMISIKPSVTVRNSNKHVCVNQEIVYSIERPKSAQLSNPSPSLSYTQTLYPKIPTLNALCKKNQTQDENSTRNSYLSTDTA